VEGIELIFKESPPEWGSRAEISVFAIIQKIKERRGKGIKK